MGARILQVIETDLQIRGAGILGDPVRRVIQYWSPDGKLLAECDTWRQDEDRKPAGLSALEEKLKASV